jgi:hypothetical protein
VAPIRASLRSTRNTQPDPESDQRSSCGAPTEVPLPKADTAYYHDQDNVRPEQNRCLGCARGCAEGEQRCSETAKLQDAESPLVDSVECQKLPAPDCPAVGPTLPQSTCAPSPTNRTMTAET